MTTKSTFHIPTVDISPYIADSTGSAAAAVVDQIRAACSTSGFFQIVGHGVAKELQSQVVDAAKAVFSLPVEEKLKLSGIPGRGYEAIGTQALEEGKPTDLKEVCFACCVQQSVLSIPYQQWSCRDFTSVVRSPTISLHTVHFSRPMSGLQQA